MLEGGGTEGYRDRRNTSWHALKKLFNTYCFLTTISFNLTNSDKPFLLQFIRILLFTSVFFTALFQMILCNFIIFSIKNDKNVQISINVFKHSNGSVCSFIERKRLLNVPFTKRSKSAVYSV